jgi:hypothetical protein
MGADLWLKIFSVTAFSYIIGYFIGFLVQLYRMKKEEH